MYLIILILLILIISQTFHHRSIASDGNQKASHRKGDLPTAAKSVLSESHQNIFCDQLKCIWVLLQLLLLRPHNIPLVAMVFLLEEVLSRLIALASIGQTDLIFLFYWFGQASFFWQVRYPFILFDIQLQYSTRQ